MTECLWFLVGLFIGGIVTTLVLCCLQINRINEYEAELRKLRSQLNRLELPKSKYPIHRQIESKNLSAFFITLKKRRNQICYGKN